MLHRIGLLDVTASSAQSPAPRGRWRRTDRPSAGAVSSRLGPWLLAAGIAALGGFAVFVSEDTTPSSLATSAIDVGTTALPVPAASEAHLSRAQQLFDAGKLPDALRVLDRVDQGDAAYADAQALRGRVQRELLAAAGPASREAQP